MVLSLIAYRHHGVAGCATIVSRCNIALMADDQTTLLILVKKVICFFNVRYMLYRYGSVEEDYFML